MTTWQTVWVVPRSTCSHWGSAKALDQRVVWLPSVALEAGQDAPWTEDAVVGWCNARFVVPHEAAEAVPALKVTADGHATAMPSVAMTVPATCKRERRRQRVSVRIRGLMGMSPSRES